MKKFTGVIFAVCLALAFAACASSGPANEAAGGMPDWVLKHRRDKPEDVIVGVGTAKMATMSQSMNISESRARASIVRALDSMVKDMIDDLQVSNEMDTSAAVGFQGEITKSLAKANLSGAQIIEQNSDQSGNWWTVIYFDKANSSRTISQSAAAAKLAVPAAIAFDALERMDKAFDKAAKEEWVGITD